jgi:DNA repair exonuclease SbcCD ATPase subunit
MSLARWDTVEAGAREEIRRSTEAVAAEVLLQSRLSDTKKQLDEVIRQRESLERELKQLPTGANSAVQAQLDILNGRLRDLQRVIARERQQLERLAQLEAEFMRQSEMVEAAFEDWQARYSDLFDANAWQRLRPTGGDDVKSLLVERRVAMEARITALEANGIDAPDGPEALASIRGLHALKTECDRLTKLVGTDAAKLKRRTELARNLSEYASREEKLRRDLERIAASPDRVKVAQARRLAAYQRLFQALDNQVAVLEALYRPLRERLEVDERLAKLAFSVGRIVDVATWASAGEEMIDRRRDSPFKQSGTMAALAEGRLREVWTSGTPQDAQLAMASFSDEFAQEAIKSLAGGVQVSTFGEWLFSTDHIQVQYNLKYEGIELERLSPGTRGVLLLTLYLGLDDWDDTPLIIDQPEENLDPQSIYDDLVGFFRSAARRRQVVLVTHNANLVVNGDADQVIIATSQRLSTHGLPAFSYQAGGLEDAPIRDGVCRLLEGGAEAFEKRRLRYRN